MGQWYCKLQGAAAGPFARDELDYLVGRGQLEPQTEIRQPHEKTWSRAEARLPELFAAARTAHGQPQPAPTALAAAPPRRTMPPPAPPIDQPSRAPRNVVIGAAIGTLVAGLIVLLLLLLLTFVRSGLPGGVAGRGGGQGVHSGDGSGTQATGSAQAGPAGSSDSGAASRAAAEEPAAATQAASTGNDDAQQPAQPEAGSLNEPQAAETLEPAEPPKFSIANAPASPAPEAGGEQPEEGTARSGAAPDVREALTGRTKGKKEELLRRYGGTGGTENAVELGLAWLIKQQQADGGWLLQGAFEDPGRLENRAAATAMALLALQGAGHTHREGKYQAEVARGWEYLLGLQKEDGLFQGGAHPMYAHAQATIAVCELVGMTRDERFQEPAQRAINYCVQAQSDAGGWRYAPKMEGDVSVTGWFVMALQSGRMAGLQVPDEALERVGPFLDSCASNEGATYGYVPGHGPTPAMTAEALLCRQYLGWWQSDPRLKFGASLILANPIQPRSKNVYYWYYATQVLHHLEGPAWDRWNKVLRVEIPKLQEKSWPEKGSWSPQGDQHGLTGGRLYETCLALYMLEVYYRHLPIYRK